MQGRDDLLEVFRERGRRVGTVARQKDVDLQLDVGAGRLDHVEPLDGLFHHGEVLGKVPGGDRSEARVGGEDRSTRAASERTEDPHERLRIPVGDR